MKIVCSNCTGELVLICLGMTNDGVLYTTNPNGTTHSCSIPEGLGMPVPKNTIDLEKGEITL